MAVVFFEADGFVRGGRQSYQVPGGPWGGREPGGFGPPSYILIVSVRRIFAIPGDIAGVFWGLDANV